MNEESLDRSSFLLQLISVVLLLKDYNNADLMQELQKQDSEYLEKIVKQNEEIITLLKENDKRGR